MNGTSKKKNKGFTLIELVATIALLAIISVISYVSISRVLQEKNAKQCVSLNDTIKLAAKEYVADNRYKGLELDEFSADILVENNYLKGDLINPYTNEKMKAANIKIEVEKNADWTVKNVIVKYDVDGEGGADAEELSSFCKFEVEDNVSNGITEESSYNIIYNGNGSTSGTMQDTACGYGNTCRLRTNTFNKTGYYFNGWNTKADGSGTRYNNNASVIDLTDGDSITLYAQWKAYVVTINYNVNGGIITPNTKTYTWTTDDNGLIYQNGSIYLTTIGYGKKTSSSGLANWDNANFIKITKNGYIARTSNEWKCLSDNCAQNSYNDARVYNASDFCDASLGNCTVELGVNWVRKNYTISYLSGAEDATGTMNDTACGYGSTCSISSNGFERTSFVFLGWTTNSDGSDDGYDWTGWSGTWRFIDDQKGIQDGRLVLYARWNKNTKVTIKYNVNGGTITPNTKTYIWTTDDNGLIYQNGSIYLTTIDYGKKTSSSGLANWDNANFIKITNPGYSVENKKEWKCLSGNCAQDIYYDSKVYNDSDFCDASSVDCTVVLGVNWITNTYMIKYDNNGGSGSMSDTSCTYGSECSLRANTFTKTGYTFNGWNTKADGTGTSYSNSSKVTNLSATNDGSVTLYAQWKANSYTIKYNNNGGSGSMSDTSCTYGSECSLRANTFTKTGYTFNGWNTKVDGTGTSYSNSSKVTNLSATDGGSVTLYAQWEVNTYTITYLANGGFSSAATDGVNDSYCNISTFTDDHDVTNTMAVQTCTYGTECTLNQNKYTRQCYLFKGWTTKTDTDLVDYSGRDFDSSDTDAFYADGDTFTYNMTNNITLYAVWKNDHSWNATGNQLQYAGDQFGCGARHNGGYSRYCSVCGMSAAHYNYCYKESFESAKTTKWCPCGVAGAYYTFDERAIFDYTIQQHEVLPHLSSKANSYGGLAEGTNTLLLTKKSGNLNPIICTNHTKYTVTLNKNSGNLGTTYIYGVNTTVAGNGVYLNYDSNTGIYSNKMSSSTSNIIIPSRLGYNFLGYYTAITGGVKMIDSNGYITTNFIPNNYEDDLTLYARWQRKTLADTYVITYDGNGNTGGLMANTTCSYGSVCWLRTNLFTRTGYSFIGWNTKADRTGTGYGAGDSVTDIGNVTLYAQWRRDTGNNIPGGIIQTQ